MKAVRMFLSRYSYARTETEGVLSVNGFSLATVERPWISWFSPGGKPFESCVPDGEYVVEPWIRPDGEEVYILSNPELGVFRQKEDRTDGKGRYLVLMHRANFVTDVVGCVASGMYRSIMMNNETGRYERSVSNSGEAMRLLADQLGRERSHTLVIQSQCGTS